MAVEHILAQDSRKVIVHIGADVVELADEGVFDPVSYRLTAACSKVVKQVSEAGR